MNGRCQDINPDLTPHPQVFLTHHVISLTPNMNESASSAPYMSEAPHYVMFHNIIIHNLKPTSPSPLQPSSHPAGKNSFPAKLFQVAILTHTRARVGPQDGSVSRQADTNQNQLQATPAASSLVFYFWFQGSFQIQLPDSIQKPTAKILFVFKDQTYFTLLRYANQFPSSFSQWIQSRCCCQENLLPDLLSCKNAGQALY